MANLKKALCGCHMDNAGVNGLKNVSELREVTLASDMVFFRFDK